MSHMVIFQTPDGNPGYNQFESLEEAVHFVESLRNEQHVETARMFALEEVKFDFKPYFRVELDPPMVGPSGDAGATGEHVPGTTFGDTPPADYTPADPATPFGNGAFDAPDAPEPVVAGAAPQPTFMTVPNGPPPSEAEQQPTRRGLFGR